MKTFCAPCEVVLLSVTRIVKLNEPSAVGVPLSIPPDETVSPCGNEPEDSDQVYGAIPPVAVKVCEYAAPTLAVGSVDTVVIDTGVITVRLNIFCALWEVALLSVTRIVKLNEPSAVGVPPITPPDERLIP